MTCFLVEFKKWQVWLYCIPCFETFNGVRFSLFHLFACWLVFFMRIWFFTGALCTHPHTIRAHKKKPTTPAQNGRHSRFISHAIIYLNMAFLPIFPVECIYIFFLWISMMPLIIHLAALAAVCVSYFIRYELSRSECKLSKMYDQT